MRPLDFTVRSLRVLRELRTPSAQMAVGVVANSCVETGHGQHYEYWNLGGWKYNATFAREHPDETFWIGRGHLGEPPLVPYRTFRSMDAFYAAWLERFTPCPASGRYAATSVAFHNNSNTWFRQLVLAGYKGPGPAAAPDSEVIEWQDVCRIVVRRLASHIGVQIRTNDQLEQAMRMIP